VFVWPAHQVGVIFATARLDPQAIPLLEALAAAV